MTDFKLIRVQQSTADRLDGLRSTDGKRFSYDTLIHLMIDIYIQYKNK